MCEKQNWNFLSSSVFAYLLSDSVGLIYILSLRSTAKDTSKLNRFYSLHFFYSKNWRDVWILDVFNLSYGPWRMSSWLSKAFNVSILGRSTWKEKEKLITFYYLLFILYCLPNAHRCITLSKICFHFKITPSCPKKTFLMKFSWSELVLLFVVSDCHYLYQHSVPSTRTLTCLIPVNGEINS